MDKKETPQNQEKLSEVVKNGENIESVSNEDTSNDVKKRKIFTVGNNNNTEKKANSSSDRDDVSEVNSEVVLRPHSRLDKRRVISTTLAPYTNYRRTNSSQDFSLNRPKSGMKKTDSMVLKLIIPGNIPPNSSFENNNYLNNYEGTGNGNFKDRHKHQTYSINSHQDYPTQLNGGHINHGYSPYDLTDYTGPMGLPTPFPATPAASTHKPDNPTPKEEKKKAFSHTLVNTFSILYALFNVTVGLAVYVADMVDGSHPTAEIFSLILVSVSCLYIVYLIIDISIYMNKKRKFETLMEKNMPENMSITETLDGHFEFNIPLPELVKMGKTIRHDYCFNKDRHSTNFYLKVGAAAFCFGHLIHSGLMLGYQLIFLTQNENKFYECASIPILVLDFIYPFYSFMLLYFIFKYSNVIINKNAILARFGVMHCMSSSLCFWVWTIMREVLEAIAAKSDYPKYNSTTDEPESSTEPYALPVTMFTKRGAHLLTESLDITLRRFTAICDYQDASMATIYRDISPYLYPFSVEYSILVVGVLFLIWENIGKCDAENEDEASTSQCRNPPTNPDYTESNIAIHVDCQSSNKGLFGGFVILIITIVSSILFFVAVYIDDGSRQELGLVLHTITSLAILSTTFIACFFGYRQITKLDLNSAHHNLLDDVLLFICIPAFFLNGIFSIIPAAINNNVLGIVDIILEIGQVLLQTAFLLDGLRRSSNTKKLRKLKPGRELVTLLIIANVAMWLMQTFEVKAHGLLDHRYEFYGKELWTILGHMCLPLMMFYRFHSSVCFCDIWKYAYEPSGH